MCEHTILRQLAIEHVVVMVMVMVRDSESEEVSGQRVYIYD